MKIRILGAGFYGAHLALSLLEDGHEVEVHEIAERIFAGASGNIPARLHLGFHYPRSKATRDACREHSAAFMERYGFLTRGVQTNLYAVASDYSLVDYAQYVATLSGEAQFVEVRPDEFGLQNVEGAVLTGERHIVTDLARSYFEAHLGDCVKLNTAPGKVDSADFDWSVDCTFCANESAGVDRYEPCLVVLLDGPTDRAVTVMDGSFGSLYPWREGKGLSTLSSAKYTPFSKDCRTWIEAKNLIEGLGRSEIMQRAEQMFESVAHFYPALRERYTIADTMLSVRAMPLSGADTRLVDVVRVGDRALRVRAGKMDAVLTAEKRVKEIISGSPQPDVRLVPRR